MRLESKKFLHDVFQAAEKISKFVANKNIGDYASDDLLKSGVERQFEVMGEALNQLSKIDRAVVEKVSDYQKIISFRNILIHGYTDIDDRLVWNIVETKLPAVLQEVKALLGEPDIT